MKRYVFLCLLLLCAVLLSSFKINEKCFFVKTSLSCRFKVSAAVPAERHTLAKIPIGALSCQSFSIQRFYSAFYFWNFLSLHHSVHITLCIYACRMNYG